jgi:cytoskeletal protein RodZ
LDRQFEGRRHITQLPADTPGQRPYSSAEARELSLRPLYAILTVAVLGGWLVLWWQRFRSASVERPQASDHESAADPESDAKQPESKPEAESQSDPVGGSPKKESVR